MENITELLTKPRIQNFCGNTSLLKRVEVMESRSYPHNMIGLMNEAVELQLNKNDEYSNLIEECKRRELRRLSEQLAKYLKVIQNIIGLPFLYQDRMIEPEKVSGILLERFKKGKKVTHKFTSGSYSMELVLSYPWKEIEDCAFDPAAKASPLMEYPTASFICRNDDQIMYEKKLSVMLLDEVFAMYSEEFRNIKALFEKVVEIFEFQLITKLGQKNFLGTLLQLHCEMHNKELPLWFDEKYRSTIENIERRGEGEKMYYLACKLSDEKEKNVLPAAMPIIYWYRDNLIKQTERFRQLRDPAIDIFTKLHCIAIDEYAIVKIKESEGIRNNEPSIFLVACSPEDVRFQLQRCATIFSEKGWGSSTVVLSDTYWKTYALLITRQFDFFITLCMDQKYAEDLHNVFNAELEDLREKVYSFQFISRTV